MWLPSSGLFRHQAHTYLVHIHSCRKHSYAWKKNINNKSKTPGREESSKQPPPWLLLQFPPSVPALTSLGDGARGGAGRNPSLPQVAFDHCIYHGMATESKLRWFPWTPAPSLNTLFTLSEEGCWFSDKRPAQARFTNWLNKMRSHFTLPFVMDFHVCES